MPNRHRTLLSIRRRDRADAVERLNRLLDALDDLAIFIDQTSEEIQCTEAELTTPTEQGYTTGLLLSCDQNHRQVLRQRLTALRHELDNLSVKRTGLERQILEAKDDVARKQQALKATTKYEYEN